MEHSYILELKYLKADATDTEAQEQWQQAVEQIRQYADGRMVKKLVASTTLHPIVVQVRGHQAVKVEEINA